MNDTYRKTAERLRICREQTHETLDQIGALVGVNKSTVLRWESGRTAKINRPTLQRLAQHFDVDEAWLSGEDVPRERKSDWLDEHALPMDELIDLPVWGTTQTGLVRQTLPDTECSFDSWGNGCFWLRMSDDSMAPLIGDGDLLLVRRQSEVESGHYAVLLLDNEECLVRRIVHGDDFIELQSSNPYYPPCRFCGTDALRVHILGLVIESKRRFV